MRLEFKGLPHEKGKASLVWIPEEGGDGSLGHPQKETILNKDISAQKFHGCH